MEKKDYDEICTILSEKGKSELLDKLCGTVGYNKALVVLKENEAKVKKILKNVKFKEDFSLSDDLKYLSWNVGQPEATLDGDFNAEELEAIAWWMRHKSP